MRIRCSEGWKRRSTRPSRSIGFAWQLDAVFSNAIGSSAGTLTAQLIPLLSRQEKGRPRYPLDLEDGPEFLKGAEVNSIQI